MTVPNKTHHNSQTRTEGFDDDVDVGVRLLFTNEYNGSCTWYLPFTYLLDVLYVIAGVELRLSHV